MRAVAAKLLALVALSFAFAGDASAQRNWPWPSEKFAPAAPRNTAGEFDYYALVMSWSPTYCAEAGESDEQQCNRRDGRRFSFVLHGLWPQYERGYPSDCRIARRPFVPQQTIDAMMDIMPSQRLAIHEYRKHGTCSGLDANAYFSLSRQLFKSIAIPQRFNNPFEAQFVSPRDVVNDFLQANPGMKAESMAVACGGSGNRLKEIRFCFAKDGKPRACGSNEDQRRMCSAQRLFVPPTRSTARDQGPGISRGAPRPSPYGDRAAPSSPLPGPRMDGPRMDGGRGI